MNQKPAMMADFTTQWFLTQVSNQQTTQIGQAGNTQNNATNVQFTQFNDGIAFSVTPQISGNQVRLWMNPTVSDLIGEQSFLIPVQGSDPIVATFPIITTKSVWTNVIVFDGDTLVLGGLIEDTTAREEVRVPYLAGIPLIGYFFRGKSKTIRQNSLLIFVTPTIVDRSGARYFESEL
jgi:type II secretory pathway component GspD/PulD (secretin)